MELEEEAEEILETLWIRTEEEKEDSLSLDDLGAAKKKPIEQLLRAGYISLSDDQVILTSKGQPEATSVVRRHRLAERLLTDVLGTRDMLIHEKACKFEHLLDRGLDESICSLLGHPKICPDGYGNPSRSTYTPYSKLSLLRLSKSPNAVCNRQRNSRCHLYTLGEGRGYHRGEGEAAV